MEPILFFAFGVAVGMLVSIAGLGVFALAMNSKKKGQQ